MAKKAKPTPKAKKTEKPPKGFVWPVNSKRITQYKTGSHHGVDVGVPIGTRLVAPEGGKVVAAGWSNSGYGKYVEIQAPDGRLIILGHLSNVQVRQGQTVVAGQQVGLSGNTGNSTGPHVHIEVRKGSGYDDPLALATGGYQLTQGPTVGGAGKGIKADKPGTTGAGITPDVAGTRPIANILPGILPDIQVNWGNVAAGVVGVGLIAVGVLGLVMGETTKAALQPITDAIKGTVEGQT